MNEPLMELTLRDEKVADGHCQLKEREIPSEFGTW
jgi:hypothetical protein